MVRKILFLASNPTNTGRLRLDEEVREISEGLKRSNERDQFRLISRFAVRVDDLRRNLLDHSPEIVHFSGHGTGANGIVLEDQTGKGVEVSTESLADLFGLCAEHVECVVLNACYSDAQADAISKHIRHVIGMNASVLDDTALAFAVAFYDALGAGRSIDQAFQFGRVAVAMKGIPEHLIPILRINDAIDAKPDSIRDGTGNISMDVSVLNEPVAAGFYDSDNVLRYLLKKNRDKIEVQYELGYFKIFIEGGPIFPLRYMTPSYCPFQWDFPTLDFKFLNNSNSTVFLTEVRFDIEESIPNAVPLLTIRRDVQRRNAGKLMLTNEGLVDLVDVEIHFNIIAGDISTPLSTSSSYRHLITVSNLADRIDVDVTEAFQKEGVNIEQLILLTNGDWETNDVFVLPTGDGSQEKISDIEMERRLKDALGPFQDWVGTLAGEISFSASELTDQRQKVRFQAPVYLSNENRSGLPRPPTHTYGATFDVQNTAYQIRVPISHELRPSDTDRFTIKIAVARSSSHRFHATILDITGQEFKSLPIELKCFVPRSRRSEIDSLLNSFT